MESCAWKLVLVNNDGKPLKRLMWKRCSMKLQAICDDLDIKEKQRDVPKHHSTATPIALNTFRNTYTPPQINNNPNTTVPNTPAERRNNFRKGIFCAYCKKEGHSKEECYKLLGYHPRHPLHNKYQLLSQRGTSTNKGGRTVNMVVGETLQPIDTSSQPFTPLDQCSTSASSSTAKAQVHARMDQLQNQLNQVLLMIQNAQTELPGVAPYVAGILSFSSNAKIPTKITSIHSFNSIAKMHSFIASNITKSYFVWVVDSGATDHICISLSIMHNITKLTIQITVYLPNSQSTQGHDGSNTFGTLHGGLYLIPSTTTPPSTVLASISNSHL
ncbi:cysteine-rich receptor-like protein kinase 8 [Tanacetum coccineum]